MSTGTAWHLNFGVNESTTVNDTVFRSVDNIYRYRNLELKVAVGGNTTIYSLIRDGRVLEINGGLRESNDSIKAFIMQNIVESIPHLPTVNTVIGWLNTAGTEKTVTLGFEGVSLTGGYTTAVGAKLANYELHKCTDYGGDTKVGHYFYFTAYTQYEGRNNQVSNDTTGKMSVQFDTFNYVDYSTTHNSKVFDLVYDASYK